MTMTIENDETNPKLPLWDTIRLAYSSYFHHFGDVLRISWLWLLLLASFGAIASLRMGAIIEDPSAMRHMHAPAPVLIFGYLITFFATVSIAVAWHRRLLLNETPGFSGSNIVTGDVWRYIGIALLIFRLMVLPFLVAVSIFGIVLGLSTVLPLTSYTMVIMVPVSILAGSCAMAVMLRLGLLLPARAIGDDTLTFTQSWHRTAGNTRRIFLCTMICTAPTYLASEIILPCVNRLITPEMIASGAIAGPMAVISALFMSYSVLTMPIFIGFLSYTYRHFFMAGANPTPLDHGEPYDGSPLPSPTA